MKNNPKNNCIKFMLLMAVGLFYACNRESYTITGTLADAEYEGKQVMLGKQVEDQMVWLDTVVITNGTYQFKGQVEKPVYAGIVIDFTGRMNAIPLNLILENAEITVTTNAEKKSKITGTANNGLLQTFLDAESELTQKRNDVSAVLREAQQANTLTPEQLKSLSGTIEKYDRELQTAVLEFVKNNINNVVGFSQVHKVSGFSHEQLKEVVSGATEETLKKPIVAKLVARIQGFENTAIGQRFTDFRMSTPEGQDIALSDYAGKGKYVFIDFWASWCGPCRKEIPYLLEAYKKYKDKGFEIVGVSFDADHKSWMKGIKDFGLTWPQMSDVKGWNSEAVPLYAISGIPHTILLDKDGIIIAKNLRGKELEEKLKEIL